MNNKSSQLILVTGASSGIGKATVIKLLNSGVKTIGIGRNIEILSNIKINFQHLFDYIICDLSSDYTNYESIVGNIVKNYGKISGYVHSAGILNLRPLQIWNKKEAIADLNVHLFSAIEFIKEISKTNNKQDLLNIVLVSSTTSINGNPGSIDYGISKAGINNLVVSLSKELSKKKIRINSVLPGFVQTNMTSNYQEQISYNIAQHYKNKTFFTEESSPEYIAEVIYFLLSKQSYWIQGQNIIVDGGEILC